MPRRAESKQRYYVVYNVNDDVEEELHAYFD